MRISVIQLITDLCNAIPFVAFSMYSLPQTLCSYTHCILVQCFTFNTSLVGTTGNLDSEEGNLSQKQVEQ